MDDSLRELVSRYADGDLDVVTCEERTNLGVVWYENPTRKSVFDISNPPSIKVSLVECCLEKVESFNASKDTTVASIIPTLNTTSSRRHFWKWF